jgi:hypothetical protein
VSGLNEAFVIDTPTRDRLIAEDRKSGEILKPFLEEKDLKAWRVEWRGLWLIYAHHGVDISRYPAIRSYLTTYRTQLERRATIDHHEWYELQQPQFAFTPHYQKPKIIYPHFSRSPKFSFDPKGFYGNDKTYCIPLKDSYLLGVLNSPVIWFIIQQTCPAMRGGLWRYELRVQYIEKLPIVEPTAFDRNVIADLADQLSTGQPPTPLVLEAELFDRVARLYGLNDQERASLQASTGPALVTASGDEE